MSMKIAGVDLGIPCFPNSPHLGMTRILEVISGEPVEITISSGTISYAIDSPQLKAMFEVKVDKNQGSIEHRIIQWELDPELKAQGYICAGLNLIAQINTTSRRRYTQEYLHSKTKRKKK